MVSFSIRFEANLSLFVVFICFCSAACARSNLFLPESQIRQSSHVSSYQEDLLCLHPFERSWTVEPKFYCMPFSPLSVTCFIYTHKKNQLLCHKHLLSCLP